MHKSSKRSRTLRLDEDVSTPLTSCAHFRLPGLWFIFGHRLFLCPPPTPDGKDTAMKKDASKKRTSSYDPNRQCYLADDGTAYYYERLNPDNGRYERISLTVGQEGITEEIILLLDSMDHDEDLGNRYENENKDPLFEAKRNCYEADPEGEHAADPWEAVSWPGDDPVNILFAEEVEENPDIARVREIIDTKCNERQQNLFFSHFGEGKQLEQIRKEEVAASGREKSSQAILNVKNDLLHKVAVVFGVDVMDHCRKKRKSRIDY